MSNSSNNQFLELCLTDLESDSTIVRIAAYTQLHTYIDEPKVKETIKTKLDTEKDLECRRLLQQLFQLLPQEKATKPKTFLDEIKELDENARTNQIADILSDLQNKNKILAVLEIGIPLLNSPEIIKRISSLVNCNDALITAKSFQILTMLSPESAVEHIPSLLKHKNPLIRMNSINFLFKIKPNEALRLLSNLVQASDAKMNNLSLSFMYLLPFQDVWPILMRLIDKGSLEKNTLSLIIGLVKTNPDPIFFSRLVFLNILKGKQLQGLSSIIAAQLEALEITQQIDGSPREYYQKVHKEQLEKIASLTGKKAKAETQPATPNKKKETQQIIPSPEAKSPKGIFSLLDANNVSEQDQETLIAKIKEDRIVSTKALNWLTENLDQATTNIKLKIMDCLYEVSPRNLSVQLPILAQNQDFFISSQAIRYLRLIEGKKFPHKLNQWLNCKTSENFNAALTGLAQLELSQSLPIIVKFIAKCHANERIGQILNILQINPDYSSVSELTKIIRAEQDQSKKKLLETAKQQIKENLEISGLTQKASGNFLNKLLENPNLKEKWDDILYKIENVKYSIDDQASTFSVKHLIMVLVLVQVILLGYFGYFSSEEPVNVAIRPSKPGIEQIKFKKNQKVTLTLLKYDAFNKWWLAINQDKKKLKLVIPENPHSYEVDQKISGLIDAASFSPAGYPLIRIKNLEKIK